MFRFIYPNKDNTISNAVVNGTPCSASNSGLSEILELYHLTQSNSTYGKSRILIQFDLTEHSQSIAAGMVPTSSVEYRLRLKNAKHYETLPSSFDIEVYPLSRSWDEGNGLAMIDEELKDKGFSNWGKATSLVSWSITGSDYVSSSAAATQHFDFGDEDLNVDISHFIYMWLTGGIANHGMVVKFTNPYETGSTEDLYVKKFFSRHAHVAERIPRVEALWNDAVQDDRSNMHYGVSGTLYYYRVINGQFQNLGNSVFVNIINSSSTVVQTLTASIRETGVYEVSGVLVSATSSTVYFRDVWFNGATQYFTGAFRPNFATGSQNLQYGQFEVSLPNLKHLYSKDELAKIKVFARKKNYAPAVVFSGSISVEPTLLRDAYFSIENANTEEQILNYSTGSNKYSKLSYDENGNYFELSMKSFHPGNVYKIKILANHNGEELIFDKNWLLKVQ